MRNRGGAFLRSHVRTRSKATPMRAPRPKESTPASLPRHASPEAVAQAEIELRRKAETDRDYWSRLCQEKDTELRKARAALDDSAGVPDAAW